MYDGVRKRSFVKLLFVLLSHMMASAAVRLLLLLLPRKRVHCMASR